MLPVLDEEIVRIRIAKRIALDLEDGSVVNLGIGIPTLVSDYVPEGRSVVTQTENGVVGAGPKPEKDDWRFIGAGGRCLSLLPGSSIVASDMSFGLIRGGHLDATVLGALEVDEKGNLANWWIPGKLVPGMGGAMDLVAGAQNIIVVMTHASKNGESKLLPRCTLPLTGAGCIRRVLTDLALLEIEDGAFILREYAPSVSIDEIAAKTAGKMIVADDVREMRFN